MDVISYKLPVFEGPLDLLLFLVQKNKLNIYDIPIAEVLEQYMDAIRRMQEVDLDVATEFLDMAARLVQIKSSMLLPRHEEPEEFEPDMTYRRTHAPSELLDAYLAAAGRGKRRLPPPPQAFSGIVARRIVSVSSKIIFVLRRLYRRPCVSYDSLFDSASNKSELVATFLALLELVKAKRIAVDGEGAAQNVRMLERDNARRAAKRGAEHGN